MGHPLIDEFCRVQSPDGLKPEFFRRCQRVFRDEVQPQLDECDRLRLVNEALGFEMKDLRDKLAGATRRPKPEVAA